VRKLQSDDPEQRLEAIRGLGEINEPKAIEYLVAAANDPDMRIRIKAIDTLGQIRAKEATPLLIQQLFMRDTDLGTKRRILACLGKIGDTRATGPIVDFMARDVDPAVRGNAIYALGDIGDPAAIPALDALAKDGADPALARARERSGTEDPARPEPAGRSTRAGPSDAERGAAPPRHNSRTSGSARSSLLADRAAPPAALSQRTRRSGHRVMKAPQQAVLAQALEGARDAERASNAGVQIHQGLGIITSVRFVTPLSNSPSYQGDAKQNAA
jgi:hypothetical protein